MKKTIILFIIFLLPFSASAAISLANCDNEPHDVIIRNGGAERMVTLTKTGGEIEEFGPTVSFQIKGKEGDDKPHPIMTSLSPDAEFCIWSGIIKVQRLNTIGAYSN